MSAGRGVRATWGLAAILVLAAALRIAFGWPLPSATRAFDEKYTLENVRRLLATGDFAPAHAFHPSLSYLPQTAVLGALEACRCLTLGTGSERVLTSRRSAGRQGGRLALTPLAYRGCRLFNTLIGLGSLVLVYAIGTRLSSRGTGLIAAALVAFAPWHLWSSAICNEDASFVLAILGVVWATLAALDRPTTGRYLLAGLAIGVALSTKFSAGPVALPLAIATLARVRDDRRALIRLTLAALVAVATFAVANRHLVTDFDRYSKDFGLTLRDYQRKSKSQGNSRLEVLGAGLASPADSMYLGRTRALLALAGALLVAGGRGGDADPRRRTGWRVLLLFPVTYIGAYAAVTRNISPHNWLPVLPIAALFAAEAAIRLLRRTEERSDRRGARAAVVAAIVAVVGLAAWRGGRYVHDTLVPPTFELALARIVEQAAPGRLVGPVIHDVVRDRLWVGHRAGSLSLAEIGVDRLESVTPWRLNGADALVSWAGASPKRFPAFPGERALRVAPSLLRYRGPELEVRVHPWGLLERRPSRLAPQVHGRRMTATIVAPSAPPAGATHLSLEIRLRGAGQAVPCVLALPGGGRVEVLPARRPKVNPEGTSRGVGRSTARAALLSERVPLTSKGDFELRCRAQVARRLAESSVLFWRRGG